MKSNPIIFAFALLLLAATVACGTGGGITLPNPQGNYSNASLKGSYVYQIHGFDSTGPYREIGVFTADGNGTITGGTDDSTFAGSITSQTGTYTVGNDGTGFMSLSNSGGSQTLAFTIAGASKLQLIEADNFANAAGIAELQVPSAISAALNGTFVFRLHQEFSAQSGASAAEVGTLTISGGTGSGSMDENLGGSFTSPNITSTISATSGLGRGTGTISTPASTINFVYYVIDNSRFVMLVTNANAVGSGSAELQNGAVGNGLSGNYVFGSRGDDLSPSGFFAGVATVGQFNATSGTMSGTLDSSQDGTITSNASFSSCYTPSSSGRVVVNNLSGNTCSAGISQVFWMVNPSRAFFLSAGNATVEDGTADLQQAQAFSASTFSGQYTLAMDGVDTGTIDFQQQLLSRVGTLQFDGTGKLTLNEVVNASASSAGAQSPGILTGTYSVSGSGRVAGTLNGNTLNLVLYAASPSQAYVLQSDPSFITSGMIQLQQ